MTTTESWDRHGPLAEAEAEKMAALLLRLGNRGEEGEGASLEFPHTFPLVSNSRKRKENPGKRKENGRGCTSGVWRGCLQDKGRGRNTALRTRWTARCRRRCLVPSLRDVLVLVLNTSTSMQKVVYLWPYIFQSNDNLFIWAWRSTLGLSRSKKKFIDWFKSNKVMVVRKK